MGLFNNMKFPAWTMQQLNLDWILQEIKRVMGFFPDTGNPGEVLKKTEDGTEWEPLEAVDLNINALPEDTELSDTDKLVFYDISASANRKITAPNLLNAMMSNGSPLMDGTASAGTSKKPARYDHRHPTDTSRAPASYFQNNALKIANGGTGATTAADARENLEVPSIHDLTGAQFYAINGVNFIFRRYGKIVVCTTDGSVTNEVATNASMGSAQVADILKPISPEIRYIQVTPAADIQFNLNQNGLFQVGYASSTIVAGVALRGTFVYIAAN